jgi:D-glycero-beta-D-manno-heptose-7-phosphate kinase
MLIGKTQVSILVIGDFLLDTYTRGHVHRISPEAPVPVLEVHSEDARPGGAGNVVLNLTKLNARVFAAGRVGTDSQGTQLMDYLAHEQVDLTALFPSSEPTPVKNRLIAESQQLLRVDREMIAPLSPALEQRLLKQIDQILPHVDVIALSDYGKGVITVSLCTSVMKMAKTASIPLIADPKGRDFTKYRGATILKPNLKEAYDAAHLPLQAPLEEVAKRLLSFELEHLLITRSEAGMSLFSSDASRHDFPTHAREVKDVTGAGDTVLAVLSFALAHRLDIHSAIRLANRAASIAVQRIGCAQVTLEEII